MSSKIQIRTAKEVKLQVITTEKKKAALHGTKLQNTSALQTLQLESFGGMLRTQVSWGIGSGCLQTPNTFGLDCSCLKKDRCSNDWNSRPKWEKLSIGMMSLTARPELVTLPVICRGRAETEDAAVTEAWAALPRCGWEKYHVVTWRYN